MYAHRSSFIVFALLVGCAGGTDSGGSGTETSTTTTGTGTEGSSGSTTDDPSTTSSTSTGSAASTTESTDTGTDTAPETTGSVMLCEQELNEPNDTEVIAEEISVGQCGFDRDGAVGDNDPFDFFRILFGNACLTSPAAITIDAGPQFELCTVFRCTDGNTPNVLCGSGAMADPSGELCCGSDDFTTEFSCPAGDPVVFIRTRSLNDDCQPYVFRWDGMQ